MRKFLKFIKKPLIYVLLSIIIPLGIKLSYTLYILFTIKDYINDIDSIPFPNKMLFTLIPLISFLISFFVLLYFKRKTEWLSIGMIVMFSCLSGLYVYLAEYIVSNPFLIFSFFFVIFYPPLAFYYNFVKFDRGEVTPLMIVLIRASDKLKSELNL